MTTKLLTKYILFSEIIEIWSREIFTASLVSDRFLSTAAVSPTNFHRTLFNCIILILPKIIVWMLQAKNEYD